MMAKQHGTLRVGAVAAVLLAGCAAYPALCAAASRYVDPAGSDVANDCSSPGAPCATIGRATAVASTGDTLRVAAGTYSEQVSISTSVTLIGAGAGNTIIQAPPTLPAGGNIVTIQGAGITVDLSGVTVNGPGASGCGSINAGILVRDHASANIHDNTVSNIRDEPLSGCQNGRAIRIGENATPASGTVARNTIVGYQKNGIDLRNAGTSATVSNNTITGAGPTPFIAQNGIVVVSAGATIQGNTVTGNACNHSSCGPDPINDTQSTGVLLLFAQPGSTVSGNALSGNDIGVYNNAVGPTTITGNQVRNNRYIGVFLDQGDVTVSTNVVTGGNVGVIAVSYDGNTGDSVGTLTCNRIGNVGVGIQLLDQQLADGFVPTITAHSNTIHGNTVGMDNETSALQSATANWWGCATGPGNPGCDTVTGNVDASAPLSVPAACAAATRYVDPTGSDVANDCSIQTEPCATISHAITVASPVDTLRIAAGTYSEQVTIGTSLTVIGAGAGNTIIQAPPTLPAGGNIVTIQGTGTSVEMTGFTVSGPGASGCGSINAGIQVRDHASADIHDNTVSNIRDEPLSGCQNGRAIRIGENATPASGTVTRNTVVGYQKNGIDLRNAATTATISNNTITGAGPTPLIAQNGVVVVSAGATIQGNTVTGNECNHASCGPDPINDVQSTGVLLLFAQPGSTVSSNTLSANDIGVYNNAVGPTTIGGNQVTSNRYIGVFLDQGDATVSTNVVTGGNVGVIAVSYDGNTGDSVGTLTCNRIGSTGVGIQLLDQQPADAFVPSITAHSNSIRGNGVGFDNETPGVQIATANWWGCTAGPGNPGCDTATGNVDVSSPLGGPATCAACATPADCSLNGADPPCNDPVCTVGTCGVQSRPDGTTCDDGNGCTGPDACQAGACVGPCLVGGSCTLSGGAPGSCILDGGTCGCAALASTTSTSTSSTTTSTTLPSGTDAVPIAFAGRNVVVGVGQLATLDGGGSFDPDGDALTFAWTVVKRPGGSTAALLSASTATPSLRPDVAGLYRIELIVTDGVLQSDPSTVDVTAMGVPPAISLTISDPVAGVTISADRVTVRGTIAGPANVGVSVNGVTAVVSGNVFAAADVPLTAGQNIVTATAAVPAGDVVATSIVVSSDGGPPTVELQAGPTTGLAPLTVNFSYSLRTTERVQSLTVDFDGDGSPDLTTTDPTATLQTTYTLPGLYTAHLTVTTDAGNSFQATVPIAVQDEALVVGILKDLSTSLTGQLAAGNADGALALFDDFGQGKFAGVFANLGISLPLALASVSPLEVRQVGQDVAEGWVIDGSNGNQKLFFVYFLRGADGVWRIHSL